MNRCENSHGAGQRGHSSTSRAHTRPFNKRARLTKGRTGIAEWHVPVKWPSASERGKAVLYFDEEKIDEIEISRWKDAINARLAVNTYFDPGHKMAQSRAAAGRSQKPPNHSTPLS